MTMHLLMPDWKAIFVPSVSLLEIVLRGSLVYLALFLLLRLVLKRETSQVSVTDLLVLVLLADASQNAMSADYKSVPEGVLLVATIIGWDYLLNLLGFHFPLVQRLIHPPPLPLIKEGQFLYRNMRRELITEAELMSSLRQQGMQDVRQVKEAHMEGDGRLSMIPYEGQPAGAPDRRAA
jgi:uncharacterized membrane protein YcaP (DUF421 family)